LRTLALLGHNVLPADVNFPNQDLQWDKNDAIHWGLNEITQTFNHKVNPEIIFVISK
jgi:hypothetical protein